MHQHFSSNVYRKAAGLSCTWPAWLFIGSKCHPFEKLPSGLKPWGNAGQISPAGELGKGASGWRQELVGESKQSDQSSGVNETKIRQIFYITGLPSTECSGKKSSFHSIPSSIGTPSWHRSGWALGSPPFSLRINIHGHAADYKSEWLDSCLGPGIVLSTLFTLSHYILMPRYWASLRIKTLVTDGFTSRYKTRSQLPRGL